MHCKSNLALALLLVTASFAQISNFKHIVILFQENRTPDNLFYGLCQSPYNANCGTSPGAYDIQTSNWLDKTAGSGVTQPTAIPLAAQYDMGHCHPCWVSQYDMGLMDGNALNTCQPSQNCPANPGFAYVDNSTGIMNPYFDLAIQYGWANRMFQTNQGPSFPAHQYIFGGTSALSATGDAAGTMMAENQPKQNLISGCVAPIGTTVSLIDAFGNENTSAYPCAEHSTMGDLLNLNSVSWRYYTAGIGPQLNPYSIWTAPAAISHICGSNGTDCVGNQWKTHVDLNSTVDLPSDIANCKLRSVSWVMPSGQNSDHSGDNTGGGPAWVASIVNAIGEDSTCENGKGYWSDTAIIVTWDDWGGWYDHVAPTVNAFPYSGYERGFRVPLLAVSGYTPAALVSNTTYDFGSILRFVEGNFSITEGALNFADARAATDLSDLFNVNMPPRQFVPIQTQRDFSTEEATDPDDE